MAGNAIPTSPQTIVGLLSEYNGTYQILPRDGADIFAYSPPSEEIEVLVNGNSVLNGSTIQIGSTSATPIVINNLGTGNLTISGINFSGSAAADYSSGLTTGPISGGGNASDNINFTPSTTGSRIAQLTITSDDSDEGTFTLNLYGIGTDGYATEPATGATNLTFSNVEAYTMTVGYTPTTDAEKYIVIWKKGSTPTATPQDGTAYQIGDWIGDSKVRYVGSDVGFTPHGIYANSNYYYKVFAYNGYGSYTNYNTTNVIAGNQMSSGSNIGTYYAGISSSDPNLVTDLTALINPHTQHTYYTYKTKMMDPFEIRDTVNGQHYVTCHYSGEHKVFSGSFDWSTLNYSREHTYAHSWMPTYPDETGPQYTDYNNLYPVNLPKANSPRSNMPFGDVVSNVVYTYKSSQVGENSNGSLVYEPRDEQKGNVARAIFYMATAYNGMTGGGTDDWGLAHSSMPTTQEITVLKQWHFQDLPDNYEIARHERISSYQGNRNPFVDSVDFVCHIDFNDMTYISDTDSCSMGNPSPGDTTAYVDEFYISNNLTIFPNPTDGKVYVQLNGVDIKAVEVMDMTGRIVDTFKSPKKYETLNLKQRKAGTYFINIITAHKKITRKIIVY